MTRSFSLIYLKRFCEKKSCSQRTCNEIFNTFFLLNGKHFFYYLCSSLSWYKRTEIVYGQWLELHFNKNTSVHFPETFHGTRRDGLRWYKSIAMLRTVRLRWCRGGLDINESMRWWGRVTLLMSGKQKIWFSIGRFPFLIFRVYSLNFFRIFGVFGMFLGVFEIRIGFFGDFLGTFEHFLCDFSKIFWDFLRFFIFKRIIRQENTFQLETGK